MKVVRLVQAAVDSKEDIKLKTIFFDGRIMWLGFPSGSTGNYVWIRNCSNENMIIGYKETALDPGNGGMVIRPTIILGMELDSNDRGLYFKCGSGYEQIAYSSDENNCPFDERR